MRCKEDVSKNQISPFWRNKKPFYRIVVADGVSPRNGRFIERVGTYDPRANPPAVVLNSARIAEWIRKGAQPTQTVKQLHQESGRGRCPRRKPKRNKASPDFFACSPCMRPFHRDGPCTPVAEDTEMKELIEVHR